MKHFLLIFVIVVASVGLSGCGVAKSEEKVHEYPWSLVLILKYELASATMPEGTIEAINQHVKALIGENKKITPNIWQMQTKFEIEMHFDDYATFLEFCHINRDDVADLIDVDYKMRVRAFYLERTQTFKNPWAVIAAGESTVMGDLNEFVRGTLAGHLNLEHETARVFAFESTFRRSTVDGAYKKQNDVVSWTYFFALDTEDIVIFDRFANQPLWYLCAILATGVFMAVIYLLYRPRRTTI